MIRAVIHEPIVVILSFTSSKTRLLKQIGPLGLSTIATMYVVCITLVKELGSVCVSTRSKLVFFPNPDLPKAGATVDPLNLELVAQAAFRY
jgi:hypothetical protein